MEMPLLVLAVTGAALFLVTRLAARWHGAGEDAFGVVQGAALLAAMLVVAGAMLRIALHLWPLPLRPLLPLAATAAFAPAAIQLAFLLVRITAHVGAEGLHGLQMAQRPTSDLSRARSLASQNDIDGAVKQFLHYFDQDASNPAPLFAASDLLQQYGRFEEAAGMLRTVLRCFPENDAAWARGAFELAGLFRNHLGEPQTARYLYHQVVRRQPLSELGKLAHGHLAGTWD